MLQTLTLTVQARRRKPLWPDGDEIVRALAYDELFETTATLDEQITLHFQVKTKLAPTEAAQRLTEALLRRYSNIHHLQVYHGDQLLLK